MKWKQSVKSNQCSWMQDSDFMRKGRKKTMTTNFPMWVTSNVIKSIPVTGNSILFTESPLTERKSVSRNPYESTSSTHCQISWVIGSFWAQGLETEGGWVTRSLSLVTWRVQMLLALSVPVKPLSWCRCSSSCSNGDQTTSMSLCLNGDQDPLVRSSQESQALSDYLLDPHVTHLS